MLDKYINELDSLPAWSDNYLVIVGNPTTGKLFKSTLGQLKAFLSGALNPRLNAPQIATDLVGATTFRILVGPDPRAEKHVIRLATDSGFVTGLRNATVTAPGTFYIFTGLTAATDYFIEVVEQATGFQNSPAVTQSVRTAALTQLAKPVLTVTRTASTSYRLDWTLVTNATTSGTYSYEIATDSSFASNTIIGTGSQNAPVITATFTGGAASQLLYFRLRVARSGYTPSDWALVQIGGSNGYVQNGYVQAGYVS